MMRFLLPAAFLVAASASALTIELDYSYDTADYTGFGGTSGGFFANNLQAKAALQAAAADLGDAITTQFAAMNIAPNATTGMTFSSTVSGTTIDITPYWSFNNPTTGQAENLGGLSLAANTVRIYVGAQALTGAPLGQGAMGTVNYNDPAYNVGSNASGYLPAINNATAAANAALNRGASVTVQNLGPISVVVNGTTYTGESPLTSAPSVGSVTFDADTDNDGNLDTLAQLGASWNFNHTGAPAAGKNDFYTVALHELMHALGVGGSAAWDANHSGTDWNGSEVIALKGSGTGFLDADEAHIDAGVTGTTIAGQRASGASGSTQEALMSPALDAGTRKILTTTDLAVLGDLGYTTATPVPESATTGLAATGLVLATAVLRRRARKE